MEVLKWSDMRIPAKSWTSLEWLDRNIKCKTQFLNLARLPFAFKWPCLMGDGHEGYGMPIGGVLATKKVIIPNAVGSDIGCGMFALRTNIRLRDFLKHRKEIMQKIFERIPVGKGKWNPIASNDPELNELIERRPAEFMAGNWEEELRLQAGTLGSGNHFIQFDVEVPGVWTFEEMLPLDRLMDCYVTIMIHSGSRNLGAKVATKYNEIAIDLNQRWYSEVPKEWDLAFLPIDSSAGREYRSAMNFALNFAKSNRQLMMSVITRIIGAYFPSTEFTYELDIHHNYANYENHFGENVMVHRKGAVRAVGNVIIPGSMETGSFLGRGLENPDSFMSCSHGAGRELSRQAAKKVVSSQTIAERMEANGILLLKPQMEDVGEECMEAYKPIENVMYGQKDLVAVQNKLRPIAVIKG